MKDKFQGMIFVIIFVSEGNICQSFSPQVRYNNAPPPMSPWRQEVCCLPPFLSLSVYSCCALCLPLMHIPCHYPSHNFCMHFLCFVNDFCANGCNLARMLHVKITSTLLTTYWCGVISFYILFWRATRLIQDCTLAGYRQNVVGNCFRSKLHDQSLTENYPRLEWEFNSQ